MRIDLHLHSTASDGSLSPSELISAARTGGLDVVSLTDHDTTSGFAEASAAGRGSVHVVPGIEMSTTHEGLELHMLGYFVDPVHPVLQAHERDAVERRRERMIAILDALDGGGVSVDYTEVTSAAAGARVIARPHLARVLVQRGFAHTVSEAFDRYIGNACDAYRPVNLVGPAEAIERIHTAGGIAVWAHPDYDSFNREIRRFVNWGLDGVECYRPKCSAQESMAFEQVATSLGLYVTGGSDWHGVWHGRLGLFSLGREELGAVLERGGI